MKKLVIFRGCLFAACSSVSKFCAVGIIFWASRHSRMCKLYMNFSFGSLELRECFVPVLLSLSVCQLSLFNILLLKGLRISKYVVGQKVACFYFYFIKLHYIFILHIQFGTQVQMNLRQNSTTRLAGVFSHVTQQKLHYKCLMTFFLLIVVEVYGV